MANRYFIKSGYVENPVLTFNTDSVEKYWTAERIKTSHVYQYHVYKYAREIFDAYRFKSVVDIGCGPGTKANLFFREVKDLILIDQPSVQEVVKKTNPGAVFIPQNLEEGIASSVQADLYIFSDVIEHLSDPDEILKSVKAHMLDNSLFIISTPDRDIVRGKENMQSPNTQHVREWNKEELANYLVSLGFKVRKHFNLPQRKLHLKEQITYSLYKLRGSKAHSLLFGNQVCLLSK